MPNDYKKYGKKLIPHLLTIPKLKMESWANTRMPEMLWAALIRVNFERLEALNKFSGIGGLFYEHKERKDIIPDVTLSGIANMPQDFRDILLNLICDEETSPILSSMLVLESLPARKDWGKRIAMPDVEKAWSSLANAVLQCFPHDSEESTDCRAAKLIPFVASGKFVLPMEGSEELIQDLADYPFGEDPMRAGAFIRSMEGGLSGAFADKDKSADKWINRFWQEAFDKTICFPWKSDDMQDGIKIDQKRLSQSRSKLIDLFNKTIQTTEKDSKHEAVFGIGLFVHNLLEDLVKGDILESSTGRIVLRTIAESYINLKWLCYKDDFDLWDKFRKYGCGQAKLQAIKLESVDAKVGYTSKKMLDEIANEDQWDRFLEIDYGQWSGISLRQMSEESNTKDTYDLYYNWGSSYSHAGWGAIRESNYQNCANPLHRFHQIPADNSNKLPSVSLDAMRLCDLIFVLISEQFPIVKQRGP